MKTFRQLYVWQASVELAVRMTAIADELCSRRRFALADQMQRAATSVPSNIAEGYGRLTNREIRHFLGQARGSLYELETQLLIAKRLGAVTDYETERTLLARIGNGLTKLIRRHSQLCNSATMQLDQTTSSPSAARQDSENAQTAQRPTSPPPDRGLSRR